MQWVGFITDKNKAWVCPETEVFNNTVNVGDALKVVVIGLEPYKVANEMMRLGHQPEMKFVHAHIKGTSRTGRPPRPVVCMETNRVYASINDAAKQCGIAVGNLSNHLRYPLAHKSVRGYHFEYYKGL